MPKGTPGRQVCTIAGCEKPCHAQGWCQMHYIRWRKHGDPSWTPPAPSARFWAKVDRHGPDGINSQTGESLGPCWLWMAGRVHNGYGQLRVAGRNVYAHRFAYNCFVGSVPPGLQLDHLCRVRHCVNPVHLEPVTHRENLLRGDTLQAKNAAKTHCPAGHEYSPENTSVDRLGRRNCRACQRARNVALSRRRKAQRAL